MSDHHGTPFDRRSEEPNGEAADGTRVATQLADLSRAGLREIGLSFAVVWTNLPFFCAECCRA
jgi:hypothetical protein